MVLQHFVGLADFSVSYAYTQSVDSSDGVRACRKAAAYTKDSVHTE
jgi:hypothetical protein